MPEEFNKDSRYMTEKVLVSRSVVKSQEADEGTVAIHKFVTANATVSVSMGLTVNLGNCEAAKINVQLSMPCYAEEIDAVYEFVEKWVEQKIENEKEQIEQSLERKNRPEY